jgi:hypothetical protein
MELDVVDPVAITVMTFEFGGVPIGKKTPLIDLGGSDPSTEFRHQVDSPTGVVALKCVDKGRFRCGQVVLIERGRLIQDLVGGDRHSLIFDEATQGQRMSRREVASGSVER